MQKVLENELLGASFQPLGDGAAVLVEHLGIDSAEALRTSLALFLKGLADGGDAYVSADVISLEVDTGFRSVLYIDKAPEANKIIAFSFKTATAKGLLPILGIAAAIYCPPITIAVIQPALEFMKHLWTSLVVLERPQDDHCIDVVEAILKADVHRTIGMDEGVPTSAALLQRVGLEAEEFEKAITRLRAINVVEVAQWGRQTGDLQAANNQWRMKL